MMRLIVFAVLLTLFMITTSATCVKVQIEQDTPVENTVDAAKAANRPYMDFEKEHFSLGKVQKGDKKSFTYHFTNTGDTDLEIDIISACECTTLDYSTRPVPPGESGKIDVVFDSSEKEEAETIDITIVLKNTDENNYPIIYEVTYDFEIEK